MRWLHNMLHQYNNMKWLFYQSFRKSLILVLF